MQTSADLILISLIIIVAATTYLFKIHQGAFIVALCSGSYFIQNLAVKTSSSLAIDGLKSGMQLQVINTIIMLIPILIVLLKYRKKSKLGLVKSIIGSIVVALFFTITAGIYIPALKNLINGPLLVNISRYSFQISLVAFVWMGFVYFTKKPEVAPAKK